MQSSPESATTRRVPFLFATIVLAVSLSAALKPLAAQDARYRTEQLTEIEFQRGYANTQASGSISICETPPECD